MPRAALFTFVGVVWCGRSLQLFADPQYEDPVSASDWFAVLSYQRANVYMVWEPHVTE